MLKWLLVASLASVATIPALCDEPVIYPPEGYYLVKALCQFDGEGSPIRVTHKVAEVLVGPSGLKDKYFFASYAKPNDFDSPLLRNGTRPRFGEVTYHWIVVAAGGDGVPLTKDVRFGMLQDGPRTAGAPKPNLKAVYLRHVSLTGVVSYSKPRITRQIEDLVPNGRRFPMTGRELTVDARREMQRSLEMFGDPMRVGLHQRAFVFPPPKKETEEWMAAVKEFCNERDVDARAKLLKKYVKSKNKPLKEWAEFVVWKYGWKPKAPVYDDKK